MEYFNNILTINSWIHPLLFDFPWCINPLICWEGPPVYQDVIILTWSLWLLPESWSSEVHWDIMWYNVVTCHRKIYQSLQKTITNGHLVLHSCWSPWPRTGLWLVSPASCETTATLMVAKHHRKNVSWVLFSSRITSNQTASTSLSHPRWWISRQVIYHHLGFPPPVRVCVCVLS